MATTFHAYLFFSGDCRAAFERYHEIFDGDLTVLGNADVPPGEGVPDAGDDFVMHAALTLPNGALIMGSDDPTGDNGAKTGFSVNASVDSVEEAHRVYDALAANGGAPQMPLEATFFSPAFGSVTDAFGVSWLVGAQPVAETTP